MANPHESTTGVNVDATPSSVIAESQAPGGAANSALPVVGTNQVTRWATWNPNQWWTDWTLPADPRPSWERWFDWANQLKALIPALDEATNDWQTMIGQFQNSLQTVRGMRADLASWTGPSGQTMSQSRDRLEDSIIPRLNAIQDNPAKLQMLKQTINDAMGPLSVLDAEYRQVLNDLNACRRVAERGKPIMVNLARQLLQTGTDLENSVMTDTMAPQPVTPQQVALTDGPHGPGQQLARVADSNGLGDPGNVTPVAQTAVTQQPTVAGVSGLADPGQVRPATQVAVGQVPGVAISPTLAGGAAAAPAAVPMPTAVSTPPPVMATPAFGAPNPVTPMASMVPAPITTSLGVAPMTGIPAYGTSGRGPGEPAAPSRADRARADAVVVAVPTPVAGDRTNRAAPAGVPAGLRGRAGADESKSKGAGAAAATVAVAVSPGGGKGRSAATQPRDEAADLLAAEVFGAEDVVSGTVAPRPLPA